nr:uncharacterized protein LOC124807608 [Hydra vulgaris]
MTSGHPRIEEIQPDLLKTICDIALYGSAAHEKRRDAVVRSTKTSSELTETLKELGFQVSRSGTYLRLNPRNSATQEGKRHIKTVPVKLIRSQNDKHAKHIDGKFCTETIRRLKEISSLLGPKEVFFLSQDDKARVL